MNEINFKALAEPFPKNEVKTLTKTWKDKKTGEVKKFSAPYLTARHVMNRLDKVVGPENWRDEYAFLSGGGVLCTLYIRVNGEWVGKADMGTETDVEPEKGAVSDAFKRAAVRWGIGRELYNDGTAFDDDDPPARHAPADDRRLVKPAPAPASELDAHLGPRPPRGKGAAKPDAPPPANPVEDRARALANKTCPWDGAMRRQPWQEFIEKYPEWNNKFWPAVQALGMDNDMAHEALGVESVKDWKGVNGKDTVAHLWYALVFAAVESELVDDKAA